MAHDTKTPGNRYDHDVADEQFEEIVNHPSMRALDDQGDAIARDHDTDAVRDGERNPSGRTGVDSTNPDAVRKAEQQPPDGFWTGDPTKLQFKGSVSRFRNNRRLFKGLGIGGGIALIAGIGFLSLLPLKLEMLIKTATEQASAIPEYAIKNRIEYLTKYYVAQRILGQAYGQDIDVRDGTIVKGMFNEWKAARYERTLGFTIESDRYNPRERAFNWTLRDLDGNPLRIDGKLVNGTSRAGPDGIRQVVSELNGSKEFKTFISVRAKESTKWYQYYKRYAIRKTLMRKFAVSKWAWLPERASDGADQKAYYLRDLRRNMYDNTVGRVRLKTAEYLSCLTEGPKSCRELKDIETSNTEIRAQQDNTVCDSGSSTCAADVDRNNKAAQEAAAQSTANLDATLDPEIDGTTSSKEISKLVSKQIFAKIAGGLSIVDTVFRAVNGIENGALNQVIFDRNSTAYIGYTAEILSINDQMKDGSNIDINQVAAVMEQMGDYGSSPAWQLKSGVLSSTAAANANFERSCPTDEGDEKTKLPTGETVCVDRKVISEKNPFEGETWWEGFANIAEAYMKSIGKLFTWFYDKVGSAAEALGINALMEKLGVTALIAKGMGLIVNLVFGAPVTGLESGADAGDNVIAGLDSTYFALGQTGQDTGSKGDGGGLGIGGKVMSKEDTFALRQQIAQEKASEFANQDLFARVFDTSTTQSLVSQIALRTPTSTGELARLPQVFVSSITQVLGMSSSAETAKEPFGFDFDYGYSDQELEADPNKYTDDTCEQYNSAREASYKKIDAFPIMVYTKTDPCALEKVVAASGMSAFTDGAPDYFDIASVANSGDVAATSGLDMRIATYNVKTPEQTDGKAGETNSSVRVPLAARVVKNNKFDVVGFQEITKKSFDLLKKNLTGYDSYPKSYSPNPDLPGQGPIFWKTGADGFSLVEGGTFRHSWRTCKGVQFCDKAPWVELKQNSTGTQFFVFNIHMVNRNADFGPGSSDPGGAEKREADAKELVRLVNQKVDSDQLFFIVGDMNSSWDIVNHRDVPAHLDDDAALRGDRSRLVYCVLTDGTGILNAKDIIDGLKKSDCPPKGTKKAPYQIDHIYAGENTPIRKIGVVSDAQTRIASDHRPRWADIYVPTSTDGDTYNAGTSGAWQWPIDKSDYTGLTACYPTQIQGVSVSAGHAGIDIDAPNTYPSSPVYAATTGKVVDVSDNIGGGISGVQIQVGSNANLFTVYEHMRDYKRYVHVGKTVKKGDRIGTASDVGAPGAHHLHFGVTTQKNWYGTRNNPLNRTRNPLNYLPNDRPLVNLLSGSPVSGQSKCSATGAAV